MMIHNLVVGLVAKSLFAAMVGGGRSKRHGSGLVVEPALLLVAGIEDGPNRCRARVGLSQAHAAVQAAGAVGRYRGTRHRGYSKTQEAWNRGCFRAGPAWGFELIAPF